MRGLHNRVAPCYEVNVERKRNELKRGDRVVHSASGLPGRVLSLRNVTHVAMAFDRGGASWYPRSGVRRVRSSRAK